MEKLKSKWLELLLPLIMTVLIITSIVLRNNDQADAYKQYTELCPTTTVTKDSFYDLSTSDKLKAVYQCGVETK